MAGVSHKQELEVIDGTRTPIFTSTRVFPAVMFFIARLMSGRSISRARRLPSSGMMCRLMRPSSVVMVSVFFGRPLCRAPDRPSHPPDTSRTIP